VNAQTLDMVIYAVVIAIAILIPTVYFVRYRRHMAKARQKQETAIQSGLTEPVSLHPVIDPNLCIASAGCTAACPEGEIIGIVGNRAELVSPTRCIGHGACAAACPTNAITLVFGTERRGVDIPQVKENFETNVEGIYIAGELGGMGLIRNAITQGREAVEYVTRSLEKNRAGVQDLLIIGAGPAGLAATLQAKKENLSSVTLEQGAGLGGAILSYPRQKLVMTQPMTIPLYGTYKKREITKEELLELWTEIAQAQSLEVNTGEKVEGVSRQNGHFQVTTGRTEYLAQRVLLAIGRRGTPRKLGIPGEESSRVVYGLLEPEQYRDKKLLVVGGGDSAIEAALALADQSGTEVSLSYRKDVFSRLKDKNRDRIVEAIESGGVKPYLESQVVSIEPGAVTLEQAGKSLTLENDYIFVFIGGEMPRPFLESIGIDMQMKFGEK
jgi:thioredoxin reductase (NADPH)